MYTQSKFHEVYLMIETMGEMLPAGEETVNLSSLRDTDIDISFFECLVCTLWHYPAIPPPDG